MIDSNILVVFFSSIAGIVATLTGLIGAFATFKLQKFESKLDFLKDYALHKELDESKTLNNKIREHRYISIRKIYVHNLAAIEELKNCIDELDYHNHTAEYKYDIENITNFQNQYDEIRLYSNRFGNSNSFAFDIKGNCVIEEGNAFLPKKEFEIDYYYFYLACFSSKTFEILLSIYSKQIMSGYDLGKIQIMNIPIPNVHQKEVKESPAYFKLVELAKELEKGNSFVKDVIDDVLRNSFYRF